MTVTARPRVEIEPFRMFRVQVRAVRRLSPSFVRLTFTGQGLDRMADNGLDQRVKLILPLPEHGLAALPTGPDWYAGWRALPEEQRNPIRTYTVRAVRAERAEVDVDMVLHGDGPDAGPAARYAMHARPGDEAVLLGPNGDYPGDHGGREFTPDSPAVPLLLAADETAVPAVANIVASLPVDARGDVLLEVPHEEDRFDLRPPSGVRVTWAVRDGAAHGTKLLGLVHRVRLPGSGPAVRAVPAADQAQDQAVEQAVEQADGADGAPDDELLWEVPPADAPLDAAAFYAWVAGEAATVRAIRRHLVNERGVDRRAVAFMGYWRQGRAEC